MKIISEFLKEKGACVEGYKWVKENKLIGLDSIPFVNKLIENDKLEWANWLIVRVMEYKEYVSYAVFAAEQVIDIYEKKYPNDKHPRNAIEAAKACIENPNEENKRKARAARDAAWDAGAAGDAAWAVFEETLNKILEFGLKLLEDRN